MTEQIRPYIIVVGIDFEEDGDVALGSALRIAANAANSEIHVLHVDGSLDTFDEGVEHESRVKEVMASMETICTEHLGLLLQEQPGVAAPRLVTHCGGGDPALQLVQLAASLDADLVVVGSRGRTGLKRFLLGSVAERVTRRAGCSVVIARPRNHHRETEVVIEPPCPECVKARAASGGKELWCERHQQAKYHPVAHRYVAGGSPSIGGGSIGKTIR